MVDSRKIIPLENELKINREIYEDMDYRLLELSVIQFAEEQNLTLEQKLHLRATRKLNAVDYDVYTAGMLGNRQVLKHDKENSLYFADKKVFNKLYGMNVP